MKRFAAILLSSCLLTSCATITPNKVTDSTASYDNTTPAGYENQNSSIIGFDKDGQGIITPFGVERYNNLIKLYRIQFKFAKGVELKENDGVKEYLDSKGNLLYKLDQQHLVYFAILNSWKKDGKEADTFWDKAKALVK